MLKIINNEKYYELKCIYYFFQNGIIVCGNKAIDSLYEPMTFFYYSESNHKIQIEIYSWKELYKRKEHFLKMIHNLLSNSRR